MTWTPGWVMMLMPRSSPKQKGSCDELMTFRKNVQDCAARTLPPEHRGLENSKVGRRNTGLRRRLLVARQFRDGVVALAGASVKDDGGYWHECRPKYPEVVESEP